MLMDDTQSYDFNHLKGDEPIGHPNQMITASEIRINLFLDQLRSNRN
jgi:hypothetical protein